MTFASVTFLIFFGSVLLVLWLVQRVLPFGQEQGQMVSHVFLLVASYVFYGWWNVRLCTLLMGVTLMAFFSAARKNENHLLVSRCTLFLGVGAPLAVLGLFKYYDFFVDSFCGLFHISSPGALNLILPVGISFYTFQALSYTIDVYKGKIEKEKSFLQFALYISFFPQLVAGPIVKASEFLPQLKEKRQVTLKGLEQGLQIFVFGLFKKVVLADNLSVFVDEVFRTPKIFHSGTVALAVVSYAIQIYMDFSGYSDMAIGCACCMGYHLKKNFNLPYISRNMTEFWKRWHISLSEWLQQYLYISLGGNRKGFLRTCINLMITMLLGGLWHGANWTFVIWGGLHGLALCGHKIYLKYAGKGKEHSKKASGLRNVAAILCTNIFVCLCWIFFRAQDGEQAMAMFRQIFGFREGVVHVYSWSIFSIVVVVAATIRAGIRAHKKGNGSVDGYYPFLSLDRFWSLVVFFTVTGLILGLAYVQGNPFIYFQF